MHVLKVEEGDIVYVSDKRRWLGGLHSMHCIAGPVAEGTAEGAEPFVVLPDTVYEEVASKSSIVRVERIL